MSRFCGSERTVSHSSAVAGRAPCSRFFTTSGTNRKNGIMNTRYQTAESGPTLRLIHDGLASGAVGAVSALASAFPRDVAEVVREPSPEGAARLAELRAFVERFPRQAALKRLLGRQGVPVQEDVRAPLRPLTPAERDELDAWHASLSA